jgi:RNA polymerase sigma-70 factor (ECF subfamily)
VVFSLLPFSPRGSIEAGFAAHRNQVRVVATVASHQSEPHHDLVTTQDRDLLRLCLANAPGGWEAFLTRFSGLLAFVAERSAAQRGVSLSAADRDDLVAEVMVEILRNDAAVLRAFAGRASLPTFLTVVARRVCVRSLLRARKKSRGTTAAESLQPETRENHAAGVANRDQIETLLQRLDPQVARLVRLHHLEGRSYGEISRLTGMPLGSIGPALSLARQQMRDGADHEHKPATG